MDLENQDERPTEDEYQAAMAGAAATLQGHAERADAGTHWPIARLHVGAQGELAATFYAPGLPEGSHDVWCLPVDATAEIQRLRAGFDRYEVVRRMDAAAFRDAYVLNKRTGKPFDEIVANLAPFFGLCVESGATPR